VIADMHSSAPVLLAFLPVAAAGDWLEGLLPLLFFLFWIGSQVVNVVRRVRGGANPGQPAAPRPVVREMRRPVPQPPQPRDPRGDNDDLARQIEAFRRAQQERPARVPPAAAPQVPPRPPVPRAGAPTGTKESRPAKPATPPPQLQRSPATVGRPGSLGGHGGEIGRHVDDAFSHDLAHGQSGIPAPLQDRTATRGTGAPLSSRSGAGETTASAPRPETAAAELVAMLRNPATVRQVILLREVLERPLERW